MTGGIITRAKKTVVARTMVAVGVETPKSPDTAVFKATPGVCPLDIGFMVDGVLTTRLGSTWVTPGTVGVGIPPPVTAPEFDVPGAPPELLCDGPP